MVKQRIFSISLDYKNNYDAETLRSDPEFKTTFNYRADFWRRYRWVVAKIECMGKSAHQRFVVSNIGLQPQRL